MRLPTIHVPPAVSIGAVLLVALTVVYVDGLRTQVADSEAREQERESVISDLESHVSDLKRAGRELASDVDRFDYENWRDVVPDVRSAADDVERAVRDVEAAVDQLR